MNAIISWHTADYRHRVQQANLGSDVEELRQINRAVDLGVEHWRAWALSVGGSIIAPGPDGSLEIPAVALGDLERQRAIYSSAVGSPVSVGVGKKLHEAETALKAARQKGPDAVVFYTPEVAKALAAAELEKEAGLNKAESNTLEKAISEIKPGKAVSQHRQKYADFPDSNGDPKFGTRFANEYDYSHILTPEHRKAGLTLKISHTGRTLEDEKKDHRITARLYSTKGFPVGDVSGIIGGPGANEIQPHSHLDKAFQGQGLGQAMYEAVYAHAKHVVGIDTVVGGVHSEKAHKLHQRLAKKHGFEYRSKKMPVPDGVDPDDIEFPYGKYRYTLKDELSPEVDTSDYCGPGQGVVFARSADLVKALRTEGSADDLSLRGFKPAQRNHTDHSDAETAKEIAAYQNPAPELSGQTETASQFHALAQDQEKRDLQRSDVNRQQVEKLKQQVAGSLEALRTQLPVLGQLKSAYPQTYSAVLGVVQGMIGLGRQLQTSDLAKSDRLPGGLADEMSPEDFDPEQLKIGIDHEKEHTEDLSIAREIAMDHLAEDPDYYRKLQKSLPPGNPTPDESGERFDYNHILTPEHRASGYSLSVWHNPYTDKRFTVELFHKNDYANRSRAGYVDCWVGKGGESVEPHSHLYEGHRGQGLGKAMYEAAFAHAKMKGIKEVSGGVHSEAASRVHQALAKKHGFGYVAQRRENIHPKNTSYPFDDYGYAIDKDEIEPALDEAGLTGLVFVDPVGKAELSSEAKRHNLHLPVGSSHNGKIKVRHYDGTESWKSVRSGQILSQDPSHHPTSTRTPGSK